MSFQPLDAATCPTMDWLESPHMTVYVEME